MKAIKVIVSIISILMILTIPLIIYGFNFNSVAFDENFYKKEFLKYDVYSDLENYCIECVNNDVLNYLRTEKTGGLIDNGFFNEREKAHMLDVKNLIGKIFAMYYSSIVLFAILFILLISLMNFKFQKIVKRFFVILSLGSSLTLLVGVLFFILSNFNFYFFFDLFHETFFIPGTYAFNPEYENIVVLYPQNLFFDALVGIVINTIVSSTVLLSFSTCSLFFLKNSFFRKFFLKNVD